LDDFGMFSGSNASTDTSRNLHPKTDKIWEVELAILWQSNLRVEAPWHVIRLCVTQRGTLVVGRGTTKKPETGHMITRRLLAVVASALCAGLSVQGSHYMLAYFMLDVMLGVALFPCFTCLFPNPLLPCVSLILLPCLLV